MNNRISIILIIVALGLGFAFAWFVKPTPTADSSKNLDQGQDVEKPTEVWTCSMDPQVRQNEPGDCPICGMDLIEASSITENEDPLKLVISKDAVKIAQIQTSAVKSTNQNITKRIDLTGRIQADETKIASIVSHIPGRIEQLFVSFTGEEIKKGQKIAKIYSPDLITAQRELLEAKKIQTLSPELLEAAKNKLKYWKIQQQQIDEIINTEQIKAYFDIYAEHTGVIENRRIAVGDHIMEGGVLFDIQNLSTVWALFDIYEDDIPHVKLGSNIEFSTAAVPGKVYKGKVSFIDPTINPKTRVLQARVNINNQSRRLKPDMFIDGVLEGVSNAKNQIKIPKTAVLWTGKRSVVYVAAPNTEIPSFSYREVEISSSLGTDYLIASGLELGEEVVTNGAFVIDASAQLNNQVSMMNKDVLVKGNTEKRDFPDYTQTAPILFKEQVETLSMAYLELKDAFVSSDSIAVNKLASNYLENLRNVDSESLGEDERSYWMRQYSNMKSHVSKMIDESNIELQRKQFDFLSQLLIECIKVFGIPDGTFYVQHCPMAFDDTGADWISTETNILNPFFGDKMLRCGIVQDTMSY